MENGHRNSGFSHEKWGFSIATLNYQRVPMGNDGNIFSVGIKYFGIRIMNHNNSGCPVSIFP
jgi:hypothetical protein